MRACGISCMEGDKEMHSFFANVYDMRPVLPCVLCVYACHACGTSRIHPPDDTKRASAQESELITLRPAPSYPLEEVLASLLTVASTGTASVYFQWDARRAHYRWAGALAQHDRAHQYVQMLKAIQASGSGHSDFSPPLFTEWYGRERIAGLSEPLSQSLIQPFLVVGSMVRRLQQRIAQLLHEGEMSGEMRALTRAVEVVLSWCLRRLRHWASSGLPASAAMQSDANRGNASALGMKPGVIQLSQSLQRTHEVLLALGRLLDCAPPHHPPFTWSFDPGEASQVLNHVYGHYLSCLPSSSSSLGNPTSALVQRTLLWVLEQVSRDWRLSVAAWVGWPGAESLPVSQGQLQVGEDALVTVAQRAQDISEEADPRRKGQAATSGSPPLRKTDPWAGARVEWTLDARGEEDVGYRLLPSKLPCFLSVAKARSVLEAGRALRLLRKAAQPDHPLVQFLDQNKSKSKTETFLPLPSWLTSEQEHATCRAQAQTYIREVRQRVAAWRQGRGTNPNSSTIAVNVSTASAEQQSSPKIGSAEYPTSLADPIHLHALPSSVPTSDPLALLAQCDELPPLSEDGRNSSFENGEGDDDSSEPDVVNFSRWISRWDPEDSTPLGDKAAQRLCELPLLWSHLISNALISVFFRDLGLPTYLATCRNFLLLGDAQFAEHMYELLFSDGLELDDLASVAPGEGLNSHLASGWLADNRGAGGARTGKAGHIIRWPPSPELIAPRFNAAVLEAIGSQRVRTTARTMSDGSPRSSRPERQRDALIDLDERLSFALLDPYISKIRGRKHSRWQDPTCTFLHYEFPKTFSAAAA